MLSYFIICIVAFLGSGLTLFSGFGLGTILTPVRSFSFLSALQNVSAMSPKSDYFFFSLLEGTHHTIFIGGVVFALALAFGLAGRDIAAHYLDVFNVKKVAHK